VKGKIEISVDLSAMVPAMEKKPATWWQNNKRLANRQAEQY
jgi:hypothetical protein